MKQRDRVTFRTKQQRPGLSPSTELASSLQLFRNQNYPDPGKSLEEAWPEDGWEEGAGMSLYLEAARRAEPRAGSRGKKKGLRQTLPWTPVTTHPLAALKLPWRGSRISGTSRRARTSGPQPPRRLRLLVTRATTPKPRPRIALPCLGRRPRPLSEAKGSCSSPV